MCVRRNMINNGRRHHFQCIFIKLNGCVAREKRTNARNPARQEQTQGRPGNLYFSAHLYGSAEHTAALTNFAKHGGAALFGIYKMICKSPRYILPFLTSLQFNHVFHALFRRRSDLFSFSHNTFISSGCFNHSAEKCAFGK